MYCINNYHIRPSLLGLVFTSLACATPPTTFSPQPCPISTQMLETSDILQAWGFKLSEISEVLPKMSDSRASWVPASLSARYLALNILELDTEPTLYDYVLRFGNKNYDSEVAPEVIRSWVSYMKTSSSAERQMQVAMAQTESAMKPLLRDYQSIEPWLGTKYQFGRRGPKGTRVDCSGFVTAVFKETFDMPLPATSLLLSKGGKYVPRKQLKVGDLLFFDSSQSGRVTHVAIYMGNDQFAHASTSKGVEYAELSNRYWAPRFRGARRYLPPQNQVKARAVSARGRAYPFLELASNR